MHSQSDTTFLSTTYITFSCPHQSCYLDSSTGIERPADENERQCRLFESILQSSSSQVLLYTDLVNTCPCSTDTVDVPCANFNPETNQFADFFPGEPEGCSDFEGTIALPVCGSWQIDAGLEAYKEYCLQTFDSVRESAEAQRRMFSEAMARLVTLSRSLANNEGDLNILPVTGLQALEALMVGLDFALIMQLLPNPCLEGCAYFMADACCEDPVLPPRCETPRRGDEGPLVQLLGFEEICYIPSLSEDGSGLAEQSSFLSKIEEILNELRNGA